MMREPALYLSKMEYIQGFPFWDYYESRGVTPFYLKKLFMETFAGLRDIHAAGFWHGDLGMPDNILLEGSYNNWTRAVIIDVEGGKIVPGEDHADRDVQSLAYMLWSIIVNEDISAAEDEQGDMIVQDHPLFLSLVDDSIREMPRDRVVLRTFRWIFSSHPTAEEVVRAVEKLQL